MLDPFPTDREALAKEVQIRFFRAGGPGGQRRNKTETAVRLFHPRSGITVTATEHRSQARNRELAFERLIAKLRSRNRRRARRIPTRKPRAADERRIEEKKRRSLAKHARRRPEPE